MGWIWYYCIGVRSDRWSAFLPTCFYKTATVAQFESYKAVIRRAEVTW